MFETVEQRFDRHVVVPDTHGEFQKVARVIENYYDDETIGFVFLGDIIDRKGIVDDPEQGVRRTLELLKNLGERAIVTQANHEWMLLGSVLAVDAEVRGSIAASWLLPYKSNTSVEANTAASYDLTNTGVDTAARLWREMRLHGHAVVLTSATPYYETDTFIAVHAGLTDHSWEEQRQYLEDMSAEMAAGIFWEQPDQWFSIATAIDAQPPTEHSKTVVSGHAHYLIPDGKYKRSVRHYAAERVLHDGMRVRLASQVNAPQNEPLYVWQDWDGLIERFSEVGRLHV